MLYLDTLFFNVFLCSFKSFQISSDICLLLHCIKYTSVLVYSPNNINMCSDVEIIVEFQQEFVMKVSKNIENAPKLLTSTIQSQFSKQ